MQQGRDECRWRPGQETSLATPCSDQRSFGSKCVVLKKGFWDFPVPGSLCTPCHHRYVFALQCSPWNYLSVSHSPTQQTNRSPTIDYIGIGARKFLGVQRIFAQKVAVQILPTVFGVAWSLLVFLQTLGAIFAQILMDFAEIFGDFVRIFRDFDQIFNKSKLLGVCTCAPVSYTSDRLDDINNKLLFRTSAQDPRMDHGNQGR